MDVGFCRAIFSVRKHGGEMLPLIFSAFVKFHILNTGSVPLSSFCEWEKTCVNQSFDDTVNEMIFAAVWYLRRLLWANCVDETIHTTQSNHRVLWMLTPPNCDWINVYNHMNHIQLSDYFHLLCIWCWHPDKPKKNTHTHTSKNTSRIMSILCKMCDRTPPYRRSIETYFQCIR